MEIGAREENAKRVARFAGCSGSLSQDSSRADFIRATKASIAFPLAHAHRNLT